MMTCHDNLVHLDVALNSAENNAFHLDVLHVALGTVLASPGCMQHLQLFLVTSTALVLPILCEGGALNSIRCQ